MPIVQSLSEILRTKKIKVPGLQNRQKFVSVVLNIKAKPKGAFNIGPNLSKPVTLQANEPITL